MRPITKSSWATDNNIPKSYAINSGAKTDLENNIDHFCSYCEVYSSDLEVEHVVSQYQDVNLKYNWHNFLLSCGRCNGRDNKSNKPVNLSTTHFPHKNNTYLSFIYKEGGFVEVNPNLTGSSRSNAENLLDLLGLDKRPGNLKYPKLNPNDKRWDHRRVAWEFANKYLSYYEVGSLTEVQIVDFAHQRGFFSVWFTVFEAHAAVKQQLLKRFRGTAADCFDVNNDCKPIPRNPGNLDDPI